MSEQVLTRLHDERRARFGDELAALDECGGRAAYAAVLRSLAALDHLERFVLDVRFARVMSRSFAS